MLEFKQLFIMFFKACYSIRIMQSKFRPKVTWDWPVRSALYITYTTMITFVQNKLECLESLSTKSNIYRRDWSLTEWRSMGRLRCLHTNIVLRSKWITVTNALAYHFMELYIAKKFYITSLVENGGLCPMLQYLLQT